MTYYIIPYGYIHNDYALVSTLLDFLLVLIMIGLTLICVLIFPFLEQLLLWITLNSCCRKDKRLIRVIETNMQGHRKRNSKTSIMFTLAISFMIFAASSFELLSTLIEKTALQYIGADMQGVSLTGYITEGPIADFLDSQIEEGLVVDYAFICPPTSKVFSEVRWDVDGGYKQWISDASQYEYYEVNVKCLPKNFLKVADTTFYYPKHLQKDVPVNKTQNGQLDAVEMLYTNDSVKQYPGYPTDNTNYYNILFGNINTWRERFTGTVKVLAPSGFEPFLSASAGDIIRLRNYNTNADWTYRA